MRFERRVVWQRADTQMVKKKRRFASGLGGTIFLLVIQQVLMKKNIYIFPQFKKKKENELSPSL